MNGWLLDTNVLAELNRRGGSMAVKSWLDAQIESRLFTSILVIAEYDKGIENLPPGDPRRSDVATVRDTVVRQFSDRVLPLTDRIIRLWGEMSGRAKRLTGHTPPVVDTMLAASAVEHDLILVTRNVRDVESSGVRVFNPWLAS